MLAKSVDARVRPLANTSLEKSSLLGAARIYVSKDTLLSLNGNLENGKHCVVTRLASAANKEDVPQEEDLQREASLWILPEKNLSPNVVMMTRAFQEATGFKIGDTVRITIAGTTPEAEEVVVQEVTEVTDKTAAEFERMQRLEKGAKYPLPWENSLASAFDRADLIFPGMVVEAMHTCKARRNFKVISVNSKTNSVAKFSNYTTTIIIADANSTITDSNAQDRGDLVVTGVPGMTKQINTLNEFLLLITQPCNVEGDKMSAAFVIHGGSGTGKTFILKRIAATKWGRVHWIKPSDKIASIRETFKIAQSQQPSIVLMDNFESLISKDRSNRDTVIETIGEELDALAEISQSKNAYTQVVVIATCSDFYTDIPEELRSSTRFLNHTPLPIPRTHERQEILESFKPPIKGNRQALLLELAQMTHAYSPKDLDILITTAVRGRKTQLLKAGVDPGEENFLEKSDLERARKAVRPTAMRDINLNPPTIHWQDVGGQDVLKKALNRMIKYTKNPEHSLRPPPKGLLLYGPPGCSKTLSAQAAATESGFNFFAVKGAELLNMYVGESERAVRTLFERARNASPSIIFFDEIDSIGGQRSGSGSATRSTGSVNMLTTLLTEMDGFEALSGVLILAATNRPEAMDPALMRPGRFDQVLYVGPPDGAAREAIFNVHLRGLPLASDVDIADLSRLAEGYSGAEIKSICDQTCMLVQERYDDDRTANKLEMTMADLTVILEKTPRNITKQMIDGYEKWSRQFKKV
ncbi:related to AAA family ATPase [Fusarium fujikuroi IMI 58289]|uniref:Related to AAA family ATPase n=1 Tax=Gibberella fujikuroi (strain CBS 195.34 / IMI 58289 / NRRL A-6831) TaxID=1279085 RepID=S0DR48_GIBF5|nr:related to AAA family ATPase [Fusarium fujikuroi IMI 58289]CCT63892.1 related to AAA family ATPase [Fusarium fujikuroi IMI 58289]SCN99059.1 related to AAA family ATPase [Fusarium fujikuroi]SCO38535.1 related to AAA family ATPase [Fusarium fujikuroi]